MAIIAISRQMGSGGYTIAAAVAKALQYEYADRQMIMNAAKAYDVPEAAIAKDRETRHLSLEVTADKGHVSLKGEVRQLGAREHAVRVTSAVPGVASVSDEDITIVPYTGPAV